MATRRKPVRAKKRPANRRQRQAVTIDVENRASREFLDGLRGETQRQYELQRELLAARGKVEAPERDGTDADRGAQTDAMRRLAEMAAQIARQQARVETMVNFSEDAVKDPEEYRKWLKGERATGGEFASEAAITEDDLARERSTLDRLRAAHRELADKIAIGTTLRRLRRAADVTIDELASRADVGRMTVIRYEAGHVAKVFEAVKLFAAIEQSLGTKHLLTRRLDADLKESKDRLGTLGQITLTEPAPQEVSDLMESLKKSLRERGLVPKRGSRRIPAWLENDLEQFAALISQIDDDDRQELLQYVRGFVSGRRKPYLQG
jgi:transcriptional regulator with XRE-family HTH domain